MTKVSQFSEFTWLELTRIDSECRFIDPFQVTAAGPHNLPYILPTLIMACHLSRMPAATQGYT